MSNGHGLTASPKISVGNGRYDEFEDTALSARAGPTPRLAHLVWFTFAAQSRRSASCISPNIDLSGPSCFSSTSLYLLVSMTKKAAACPILKSYQDSSHDLIGFPSPLYT